MLASLRSCLPCITCASELTVEPVETSAQPPLPLLDASCTAIPAGFMMAAPFLLVSRHSCWLHDAAGSCMRRAAKRTTARLRTAQRAWRQMRLC